MFTGIVPFKEAQRRKRKHHFMRQNVPNERPDEIFLFFVCRELRGKCNYLFFLSLCRIHGVNAGGECGSQLCKFDKCGRELMFLKVTETKQR